MRNLTSASRLAVAERAERIMALRLSGATYAEIGAEVGVTAARAHQVVTTLLRRAHAAAAEEAAQMLCMELDRLDALHASLWPAAAEGKLRAVDGVLRIMERRAKLLGLDLRVTQLQHTQARDDRQISMMVIPADLTADEWSAYFRPLQLENHQSTPTDARYEPK